MIHLIIDCCRCCDLPIEQCHKGPPIQTYELTVPPMEEVEPDGGAIRDTASDGVRWNNLGNSDINHSSLA